MAMKMRQFLVRCGTCRSLASWESRPLLYVQDMPRCVSAEHVGVHHHEPRPNQILKKTRADVRCLLLHLERVDVQLEDRLPSGSQEAINVVQIALTLIA